MADAGGEVSDMLKENENSPELTLEQQDTFIVTLIMSRLLAVEISGWKSASVKISAAQNKKGKAVYRFGSGPWRESIFEAAEAEDAKSRGVTLMNRMVQKLFPEGAA
jgi:hypothetical protein